MMNKILSTIIIAIIAVLTYLSVLFFSQDNSNNNTVVINSIKSNTNNMRKSIHIKYAYNNSKVDIKNNSKKEIAASQIHVNHYSTDYADNDYKVTFVSKANIEKEDSNIPLHLNIGDKHVTLSIPLLKIDDINNSKFIIKDRDNNIIAQALPYFMDDANEYKSNHT